MLKVEKLVVGLIEENTYAVINEENKALIFDPGDEANKIIAWIQENQWEVEAILLTHSHFDHIGALDELRAHFDIKAYVHPIEAAFIGDPAKNLSLFASHPVVQKDAEFEWDSIGEQEVASFTFIVAHTPGHSPGHVIYIFPEDQFIIAGDTVFRGSIGRTDIPAADSATLLESIETHFVPLDPAYRIYPGHGESTTLQREWETNPFLAEFNRD